MVIVANESGSMLSSGVYPQRRSLSFYFNVDPAQQWTENGALRYPSGDLQGVVRFLLLRIEIYLLSNYQVTVRVHLICHNILVPSQIV